MTFASPDTKNERNLDVGKGHEVLGDVNNKLVHKGRGNVKAVHVVVQVVLAKAGANVLIRAQDCIVSTSITWCLEKGINHTLPPCDVLLVI